MSEDKRLLTDDEMAKVTGGVVMEFPDGRTEAIPFGI